jgi:hypothetical protein
LSASHDHAGAGAHALALFGQIEVSAEERIVVERIGLGGVARLHGYVDDPWRYGFENISERTLRVRCSLRLCR